MKAENAADDSWYSAAGQKRWCNNVTTAPELHASSHSFALVVEFFFAYKGFGALLLEASLNQDIYLIEACTLVAVCVAVITQTLADVGYTYLNPRLCYEL